MKISLGSFLCISDNCYQVCPYLRGFSRILGSLSLAFSIAEGGQSSQCSNIFAGLRWPTDESQGFLAYFIQIRKTNVETVTLQTLSLSYCVGLF